MGAPTLIIAGIQIPQRSRFDLTQSFSRVDGGAASRRMGDGALFTMEAWEKWKTTISASGWIPPALLSIKRGVPFALHSIAPLALQPGELLPDGWAARTDWPEITLPADENGVIVRLVYPILTVATLAGAQLVTGGTNPQWELVCEET